MNAAAAHLAFSSFPFVLNITGVVLLLFALVARHAIVMRIALALLVAAVVIAFPVFVSGNRSERMVKTVESVNKPAVDPHREASLAAIVFLFIEGLLAIIARWRQSRAVAIVTLLFAVVATSTLF